MTMRILLALGLLGLAFACPAARAETPDDQSACMMDAQTICKDFIPDRVRVAHCLMANSRRIAPACRIALRHFK